MNGRCRCCWKLKSFAFGLFQPSRGPAVARTPPRRNSFPSRGRSSKLPLLLRRNLPKMLRKPPMLLLFWLMDGDGDCCGKSTISSIIFSVPAKRKNGKINWNCCHILGQNHTRTHTGNKKKHLNYKMRTDWLIHQPMQINKCSHFTGCAK